MTPSLSEIERLEGLARAATPGEWRQEEGSSVIWGVCDPDDASSYGAGVPVAEARNSHPSWARGRLALHLDSEQGESNAAFIAAANPQTILSLTQALRESMEREAGLREALEWYGTASRQGFGDDRGKRARAALRTGGDHGQV